MSSNAIADRTLRYLSLLLYVRTMGDIDLDSILDGALDDFDRPSAPPPVVAATPLSTSTPSIAPTPATQTQTPSAAAAAAALAAASPSASSTPAGAATGDIASAQKALMDLFGGAAAGAPGTGGPGSKQC